MPNWNTNTLTLKHEDPAQIKRAVESLEAERFLEEFIPFPEDDDNTYDFACNEWGTKWDVNDACVMDVSEDTVTATFDTAWSPPIEAYKKLEAMGFEVSAYYYESGYGFCGKYESGEDYCYGIDGDASWVIENIPRDIDEEFAISESMEMWEDE
jgi:hypothetical protein